MKKLWLLYLLVFGSGILSAQTLRDSVDYKTPYFNIVYSEVLEQPKSAYYKVVCPTATTSRSGMDFYTEPKIHTSNSADYINNIWDKGHLAPVGSVRCNKDMVHATFTYVNCTLQHERLNRGVWKTLEAREQQLAQQYPDVYVTIRVVFDANPPRLATNAAIPKGFYKTITYGNVVEKYYFPNIDPVSKDINYYKCK